MKSRGLKMKLPVTAFLLAAYLQVCLSQNALGSDPWHQERPPNMAQIQDLEVMCAKDHMEVQLSFDKPFNGLVFSKGQFGQGNCVYVHPKSGQSSFRFTINYNGCGTKPDMNGKFYENTIVVQYDEELIEVWDEAKRLRCEWYNDYEKTATKPPMVIADLEVVELNFRGDNVDCWMEIQNGKGPWASPITGIVPLGSTLTMVVAINDQAGEFDMRVKSCEASDGINRPIQLSDEHGCVLRPKMVSKFLKLRSNDGRSTVMTYAFFHAFKFPDSLQVHIRCKVEICRFGCPEHCEKAPSVSAASAQVSSSFDQAAYSSQSAPLVQQAPPQQAPQPIIAPQQPPQPIPLPQQLQQPIAVPQQLPQQPIAAPQYSQQQPIAVPQQVPVQYAQRRVPEPAPQKGSSFLSRIPGFNRQKAQSKQDAPPKPEALVMKLALPVPGSQPAQASALPSGPAPPQAAPLKDQSAERSHSGPISLSGRFPHGPRQIDLDKLKHIGDLEQYAVLDDKSASKSRKKRYAIHERHVRSADVGVLSAYEVISAVDLAFTPNATQEGVTIFQGRIREEIVYGICLPAPGFSALFVLLAMSVVISVLVASFLCYHRQLQQQKANQNPVVGVAPAVPFRDWSMVHYPRNP